MSGLVQVGDVITVEEPDYRYGLGQLTLRVTAIVSHPEPGWIQLKGIQIYPSGAESHERYASVKLEALRKQRGRPPL
jgi:hypothetical protein